jgi:type IV pilus assembly protein PilC
MTRIGEEAGNLEEMLEKISRVYQSEVEQTAERIKTISEPLVIVVIAVIVGFIVAAIMIPMFDMYNSLQG